MNKSSSVSKTVACLVLSLVSMVALAGCSLFNLTGARIAQSDAEHAASCAAKRAPGSAGANSARAAADKARANANETRSDDNAASAAAFLGASAAADDAIVAAASVGCRYDELKPLLAGSYNQDIFGSQTQHGD